MYRVLANDHALRELSIAALAMLLMSCAASTPVDAPKIQQDPMPEVEEEVQTYRLQVNDVVRIKFWNNEELNELVRIRPDGKISLPYVDDVIAAGFTPEELDTKLVTLYSGELAQPEITVIVNETGSQVYIGGEVQSTGIVRLTGPLTLFQAIQSAGGFLTTARRKDVLLIRRPPGGEPTARSVDLRKVMSGSDPGLDIALRASDIIFVPRTKIANVNLFVRLYINQIIPIQGIANAIALDGLKNNSNSNSTSTANSGQ
jgi:protein involved in polysaccharide export with SLBB domain